MNTRTRFLFLVIAALAACPGAARGQSWLRLGPLCNLTDGSGLPVGPFEVPVK